MPRFVPRQRKHKVLARQHAQAGPSPANAAPQQSNQEIIVPQSKVEREAKKQKLREELRAQQPHISSKKQKRLDKYIENKLRKDETLDLLRKLEQEKEKYEAAVANSSGNLGKRTYGDFVSDTGPSPKRQTQKTPQMQDDSDVESEDSFEAEHREAFDEDKGPKEPIIPRGPLQVQGSGLARPLAVDENGLPIIQSRKSKKRNRHRVEVPVELPWEGFDSEPSENEKHSAEEDSEDEEEGSSSANSDSSSEPEDASDGEDDTDMSEAYEGDGDKIKPRNSAFKAWATQQLNQSVGHTPSYTTGEGQLLPVLKPATKSDTQPPKPSPANQLPNPIPNRRAYAVHVRRPEDIQQARSQLPILQREQEIMEAVHNNPVVIIKGETGSGKTTQIPQFLFEAGYGSPEGPTPGMIGVTQPRRVAAIRFDSTVSSNTAVKFMTDGILLRELSEDLLLRKYSVIVVDEAHERSVNTDILIGMLSKIVPARMQKNQFNPNPKPLKLVIMSATLNIGDFLHEKLFSPSLRPPIVEAEGRQHRVTTHFALRSRADYVEEVIEKLRRAHRKLPRGGILVFLTGQNEIKQVGNRLNALLGSGKRNSGRTNTPRVEIAASEAPLEVEDFELGAVKVDEEQDDFDMEILTHSDDEAEEKEFDISDEEDEEEGEATATQDRVPSKSKDPYTSVHILPLYSQLPTAEQLKVFEPPPPGARLIVLATNVAETSLTIPGIRYVFDTGRSKERKYNLDTGVQSFEIDYISKASAQQRAGRAGRTGPGHCWRLYSSAVYEQFFPDHAEPEILRAPAESVVLQLKGFAYPRPIAEFPFPTPPAAPTLNKAEQLLRNLGALTASGSITDLGRQLSMYPLSPRLGKILVASVTDPDLLWHILALVSAIAVPEIFITEGQLNLTDDKTTATALSGTHPQDDEDEEEVYTIEKQQEDDHREKLRQEYGRARATLSKNDKASDAMKLLTAISSYLDSSPASREAVCKSLFLRPKAMAEIAQLRDQLEHVVRMNHRSTITSETLSNSRKTKISSSKAATRINTIVTSGFVDQIAIRYDKAPQPPSDTPLKPRRAIDVPYLPLIPLHDRAAAPLHEKAVFIHPSSVLARANVKDLPEYICYSHLQRSQAHTVISSSSSSLSEVNNKKIPKTRMFPLAPVTSPQLAYIARDTALVNYGKPVPKTKIEDLPGSPRRRECWVTVDMRASAGVGGSGGALGWPLPPVKVRQVMDVKSKTGWRVEKVLSP
ncbi:Helicase associated domain-containing protein [Cladophialophora immunda]|nr:Helicase associated domain-containing protein [Cladophialophora immunda]